MIISDKKFKPKRVEVDTNDPKYKVHSFTFNGLDVLVIRQGIAYTFKAKLGEVERFSSPFPTNKASIYLQFMASYEEYQKNLLIDTLKRDESMPL